MRTFRMLAVAITLGFAASLAGAALAPVYAADAAPKAEMSKPKKAKKAKKAKKMKKEGMAATKTSATH